jgi:hypothetical protein
MDPAMAKKAPTTRKNATSSSMKNIIFFPFYKSHQYAVKILQGTITHFSLLLSNS